MKLGPKLSVLLAFMLAAAFCALLLMPRQSQSLTPRQAESGAAQRVTFTRDIAPIVFKNCAPCHRPGESGPFSLLTYHDVKSHARQIAVVTRSRFMPPWLPAPGYGDFLGERRLTDAQIELVRQWVHDGAIEGDPSDLPPLPKFAEGWQLGEPDLVLTLPRPYELRPSGPDVFRNFVFHVPVTRTRYVKAVEIRPGDKRIVHHCNILLDDSGQARLQDGKDGQIGFAGMDIVIDSERFEPQSHFLFWKPGSVPYVEPEDMAWTVHPNTDLILNTHMRTSGRRELIQPSIGLYFTDTPPTKHPMLVQLEHDSELDIPPGAKDFAVTDSFKIPMDVDVLGVYPHAHYLGKDIEGYALLPDHTKIWLIWIKHWNLYWQAVYRYSKPVFLPKGTVVWMHYTYDNSSDNVFNPNNPPKRVVAGNQSTDEMAHLWLQLLPRSPQINGEDARLVLQKALMEHWLDKYPGDAIAHFNLGAVLQAEGKVDEAIHEFQMALKANPDNAVVENSLGSAYLMTNQTEAAIFHFRAALTINPRYTDAHYNLGTCLLLQQQYDPAAEQFRQVLQLKPDDLAARDKLSEALNAVANTQASQGSLEEAISSLREALRVKPEDADTYNNLGTALARQGKFAEAASCFENALRINPAHDVARKNLQLARSLLQKKEASKQ